MKVTISKGQHILTISKKLKYKYSLVESTIFEIKNHKGQLSVKQMKPLKEGEQYISTEKIVYLSGSLTQDERLKITIPASLISKYSAKYIINFKETHYGNIFKLIYEFPKKKKEKENPALKQLSQAAEAIQAAMKQLQA